LTFDLPGLPYSEPCFANTARRDPSHPTTTDSEKASSNAHTQDYHKDRWKKGLVGIVYEVSASDYAHIIATEGGGSAYHDILVDCHPIPAGDTVPTIPTTKPFKAHTLFAPARPPPHEGDPPPKEGGRFQRPDPSYAQASARYLKLITDGAEERGLPMEYREYLAELRPYTITTQGQRLGQFVFMSLWSPFILMIFALNRIYQDKHGRNPPWLKALSAAIFKNVWVSYDDFFKDLFGDGERTVKGEECEVEAQRSWRIWGRRGDTVPADYEKCVGL